MKEFKVIAVGHSWSSRRLARKATESLNKHAQEGWEVRHVRTGWSPLLIPTLYIILEKERTIEQGR